VRGAERNIFELDPPAEHEITLEDPARFADRVAPPVVADPAGGRKSPPELPGLPRPAGRVVIALFGGGIALLSIVGLATAGNPGMSADRGGGDQIAGVADPIVRPLPTGTTTRPPRDRSNSGSPDDASKPRRPRGPKQNSDHAERMSPHEPRPAPASTAPAPAPAAVSDFPETAVAAPPPAAAAPPAPAETSPSSEAGSAGEGGGPVGGCNPYDPAC
jgi:hypothetical protein